MRAGTFAVRLCIEFDQWPLNDGEIASVLQAIFLPFRVKRLHLSLTYKNLVKSSMLPEAMLSDLMDFSLSGKLSLALPWSQLQSLDIQHISIGDLHPLVEILHQMPKLQVLKLEIYKSHIDALQELTLPSLRDFCPEVHRDVDESGDLNVVLRSFTCPSLVKLKLRVGPWAVESFEIVKRQYNIRGLEECELQVVHVPLSISSILQSAPILRMLSVHVDAVLDDAAIHGLSSGALGRCLTSLTLGRIDYDVNEVVDMVRKRLKTVNALIENGCSWREDIIWVRD